MRIAASLLPILGLVATQVAATQCPMGAAAHDAQPTNDAREASTAIGHAPDAADPGRAHASHDHGDREGGCTTLLVCGVMAVPESPTGAAAPLLPAEPGPDFGVERLGSTLLAQEPPPPRRAA